jgi:choline kinase
MSKDVDKIDADDIGIDKLDPEMDYYVKSLAVSERKSDKNNCKSFQKRYSSLINKNPMAANTDQTSKEAAAADSEEIKHRKNNRRWIRKNQKNANKKE